MFPLTIKITPRDNVAWTAVVPFGLAPQYWSALELRWAMKIACDEAGVSLSESIAHLTSTDHGLMVQLVAEQLVVEFGPLTVPETAIEEVLKTTDLKGFGSSA